MLRRFFSWVGRLFAYEDRCFTVHVVRTVPFNVVPPVRREHFALSLREAFEWFDAAEESCEWEGGMIYDMNFNAVDLFGDVERLNRPRTLLPYDYRANLRRNLHLAGIGE